MSAIQIGARRRSEIYLRRALAYREAARAILEDRSELLDLYEPLLQYSAKP